MFGVYIWGIRDEIGFDEPEYRQRRKKQSFYIESRTSKVGKKHNGAQNQFILVSSTARWIAAIS